MDGQDIMNKRVRVEISRRGRGGLYLKHFFSHVIYMTFSIDFSLFLSPMLFINLKAIISSAILFIIK